MESIVKGNNCFYNVDIDKNLLVINLLQKLLISEGRMDAVKDTCLMIH